MFKKFKDKLAEEVKSSPQRIQQFAQVAQAAVTSASSSISDITNNDLFSIGDNDSSTKSKSPLNNKTDVAPPATIQPMVTQDFPEFSLNFEDNQRQRRLSNSSFASDISFRLPSYESPSMYHLQSDVEVSASEAEEKGFAGGTVYLDRVTKDQLYAAYRRTQDRCKKYKTQYSDLARHYKLLERENAKAKNVLVETQDKALRRISELKEQCTLEQSAKAHLEKALRVDLEEKQMKIDALNTQVNVLQNNKLSSETSQMLSHKNPGTENVAVQLIDLHDEKEKVKEDPQMLDDSVLNKKIEKLEALLNKYKESLKTIKEKNSNMTAEIQKLSIDLEAKSKENSELQSNIDRLATNELKIRELMEKIESLENTNNTLEFSKNKELSILETNLGSAKEEILQLQKKIQILSKREEEYAISLAENKLSIHKELEEKEAEIRALKDTLTKTQTEVESLNETVKEQKNAIVNLEGEKAKMTSDLIDLNSASAKAENLKMELESLYDKVKLLENAKIKSDENIDVLHLQLKQETAEKLSVIDRNVYLESRNAQLTEDIEKKRSQINKLENDSSALKSNIDELKILLEQNNEDKTESNQVRLAEEASAWKLKCTSLESEIQEERIELGKLQTEIEKLLINHESLQNQNLELNDAVDKLKAQNDELHNEINKHKMINNKLKYLKNKLLDIRNTVSVTSKDAKSLRADVLKELLPELSKSILFYNNAIEDSICLQKANASLKEEITKVKEEFKLFGQGTSILKEENVALKESLKENNLKCEQMSTEIQALKSEYDSIIFNSKNKINDLENENKALLNHTEDLKTNVTSLTQELVSEKQNNQENVIKIQSLQDKNIESTQLQKEYNDKVAYIEELKNQLQAITEENNRLRTLEVEMNNKISTLESQINELVSANSNTELLLKKIQQENQELKLSYKEQVNNAKKLESDLVELHSSKKIELERTIENLKDQNKEMKSSKTNVEENNLQLQSKLQEMINGKLELEEKFKSIHILNQDLQASYNDTENRCKQAEIKINELQTTHSDLRTDKHNLEKVIEQYAKDLAQLKKVQEQNESKENKTCECNILKDENRRLLSDIEGLQTYLTKISKENSDLNDKMREFIASSDHSPEGNDYLKNEIQIGKDKIDELLRENSILVEENLELKDQIQSQIHSSAIIKNNDNHRSEHKGDIEEEKYYALLENKNQLEVKVNELEQMNNSLNKNVDQTQVNYDRLKLSNEKLQRKLDEALVSLRHLHALEENTELEYLRNILYEYLTGSGTHSITLAKVLAAVVKFDDRQTEQVLQKEKERQGFLRQLGII